MSRFAYRKLQLAVTTKAIEYNVPVVLIDTKNTSSLCPRCGAKLSYNHRLAICKNCGLIADRGKVGAMNIYLKALKHLAPRLGSWGPTPMTDETRPKDGLSIHEPMTTHI